MQQKNWYFLALAIGAALVGVILWQNYAATTPTSILETNKETNNPTTTTTAEWVTVDAKGETMLFGKKTTLDALSDALRDTLGKMPTIPKDIPVKFAAELLILRRYALSSRPL